MTSEGTLFDIEPVARTDSQSPQIFRPVARKEDPDTSHKAAQSVRNSSNTQEEILTILLESSVPLTDEEIAIKHFIGISECGWKPVSPSGLRSRRDELVDQLRVKDSGKRGTTKSGRTSIRWEAVRNSVESVDK